MSGLFNRLMSFAGLEIGADHHDEPITQESEVIAENLTKPNNTKILNLHSNPNMHVIITSPSGFDEACDVIDHLKLRKPVIINLERLDQQESRRMIDFLSGSIYSIDGNIQKITTGIFLLTPSNINITGDFKNELTNRGIFSIDLDA